jgi:glucose/arabinose dehydrogenase
MKLPRGILAAIVPLVLITGSASAYACERRMTDRPDADGQIADRPIIRASQAATTQAVPGLRVTTEVSGLTQPWDVKQLPAGPLLITERETRRILVRDRHGLHGLSFPNSSIWVSGETGLMSLAIDPGFGRTNRRFYTCQGRTTSTGGHEIAVVAWRLGPERKVAAYIRTVLRGIQITTGRHGGCRLLMRGSAGPMYVGTGDSAVGTNPQDLTSPNGKVLRLDPATGKPWPSNPFIDSADLKKRYIYTFGHRNVQGLALRKDGTLWSVEHGTSVDDEVNRLRWGGNYGWNPVPLPYNESVPMTDHSLPGTQIDASWSSGAPTIATSGATFVRGSRWGSYDGALAVAALAGNRVVFMKFDAAGRLLWTRTPSVLRNFGRLRSVTPANNGDLLITTANGGADRVLRVRPIT